MPVRQSTRIGAAISSRIPELQLRLVLRPLTPVRWYWTGQIGSSFGRGSCNSIPSSATWLRLALAEFRAVRASLPREGSGKTCPALTPSQRPSASRLTHTGETADLIKFGLPLHVARSPLRVGMLHSIVRHFLPFGTNVVGRLKAIDKRASTASFQLSRCGISYRQSFPSISTDTEESVAMGSMATFSTFRSALMDI